jgi:KDO2-lipid IV(A) lauroyltransferase
LFRPIDEVASKVVRRIGWESVEKLREGNRPIVFVIPHLGGYDVAGRYLWTKLPILAMYRPNKLEWFDQMMREGRDRGAAPDGTNTAPATMAGVRMILKHLRRGGCSVVLPDQVPGQGDGEWVDFFGTPAYTMTLVGRLQEASGAALVFCFAERLPNGEGFVLHCDALEAPLSTNRRESARHVNEMVEKLVRMAPSQYLWGYNRYKRPAGAPPPPDARWAPPDGLLRKLGSELGAFVLWLLHFLPLAWLSAIGAGIGSILYRFGRGRVTQINLAMCFPEMPERERRAWASGTSACSGATPSSSRRWCGAATRTCST